MSPNKLLLLIMIASTHQLFAQSPIINGFSPSVGPVGTSVNITGTNFSSTPSDNIVFFGAVKAIVNTGSANSLLVTAPVGASFQPITVTVNGLTAYSANPFITIFPDSVAAFTTNSFPSKTDFATGTYPKIMAVNDFDGDGKPDIAVVTQIANSISVLRNISADSIPLFSPKLDVISGSQPINIVAADLDGDGKADLVVTNFNGGGDAEISIYRNLSSRGNILFGPRMAFATGAGAIGIAVGDLNSDGKPDIVVTSGNAGFYSVFKNTSVSGNIMMASRQDISYYRGDDVAISDLDGDKKPDLVLTSITTGAIVVQLNTSTASTISFAPGLSFTVGTYPSKIALGDFDGDNKTDVAVTNYVGKSISILRNLSTTGAAFFETAATYSTVGNPSNISIADLDGDTKPDLVAGIGNDGYVTVFKNKSSNNVISFDTKVDYSTGNFDTFCATGDFTGDGRQDIAVSNTLLNTISILTNKTGLPVTLSLCPPVASYSIAAGIPGAAYQWQIDSGNGFANIISNDYYSNTNGAILQLINIPSVFNGHAYRCVVDGKFGDVYKVNFTNSWTGTENSSWNSPANWQCNNIPDSNTNVVINGGNVVIDSNVTINSLVVNSGASVTISTGVNLVILHPLPSQINVGRFK